jgi:hypothetical protein
VHIAFTILIVCESLRGGDEMPDSNWINAEALATYIVGVISSVIVMLGWRLFNIKRPRRIVCQQTSMLSLVEIDERIKPRITVVLDKGEASERQVEELSQTVIDISNTSKDTIDEVNIKFKFDVPVLGMALDLPSDLEEEARAVVSREPDGLIREIVFSTPYLNSSKTYKDRVELTVLTSDRPTVKVTGGGRDWKVYYVSIKDRQREIARRIAIVTNLLVGASITTLIVLPALAWNGLSWRKGVILGFFLAGIVGFLQNRILWRWGLAPMRAFFKPRRVPHQTDRNPFRVFQG